MRLPHLRGQQAAPVHKLEQVARLGRHVPVGGHGLPEGGVRREVLAPEPDHQRPGQERLVVIVSVGRQIQVQGLQSRVQQNLSFELGFDFRVLQQLQKKRKTISKNQ